jgi:hypothetical protein
MPAKQTMEEVNKNAPAKNTCHIPSVICVSFTLMQKAHGQDKSLI